jgi:tetratricopeptide (TPR) repeat protein
LVCQFGKARQLEPDDLDHQASLGQAFLRLDRLDRAEQEYGAVLQQAHGHVDALIGMGEVFLAIAERARKEEGRHDDLLQQALDYFNTAIDTINTRRASRAVGKVELANLHYLCGYTRVQLYESARLVSNQKLKTEAEDSFRKSWSLYKGDGKADRALKRLQRPGLNRDASSWAERFATPATIVAGVIMFLIAQAGLIGLLPGRETGYRLSDAGVTKVQGLFEGKSSNNLLGQEELNRLLVLIQELHPSADAILNRLDGLLGKDILEREKPRLKLLVREESQFRRRAIDMIAYITACVLGVGIVIAGASLARLRSLRMAGFQLERGVSEGSVTPVQSLGIGR